MRKIYLLAFSAEVSNEGEGGHEVNRVREA